LLVQVDRDLDVLQLATVSGLVLDLLLVLVDPLEVGSREEALQGLRKLDTHLLLRVGSTLDGEAIHYEALRVMVNSLIGWVDLKLEFEFLE
jgi:hypothetical protein